MLVSAFAVTTVWAQTPEERAWFDVRNGTIDIYKPYVPKSRTVIFETINLAQLARSWYDTNIAGFADYYESTTAQVLNDFIVVSELRLAGLDLLTSRSYFSGMSIAQINGISFYSNEIESLIYALGKEPSNSSVVWSQPAERLKTQFAIYYGVTDSRLGSAGIAALQAVSSPSVTYSSSGPTFGIGSNASYSAMATIIGGGNYSLGNSAMQARYTTARNFYQNNTSWSTAVIDNHLNTINFAYDVSVVTLASGTPLQQWVKNGSGASNYFTYRGLSAEESGLLPNGRTPVNYILNQNTQVLRFSTAPALDTWTLSEFPIWVDSAGISLFVPNLSNVTVQ
jgi:hypothetical protein